MTPLYKSFGPLNHQLSMSTGPMPTAFFEIFFLHFRSFLGGFLTWSLVFTVSVLRKNDQSTLMS